ncbi:polyamine-modulated factor 1 [Dunckerocampus dactyliophorus]|uniref:polyamine-modulated factor 1 n=1 Tax=Dunckerocampus dactyliophorus TaxID=161453 RepID=UPI002406C9B2|nr:polyamine-modulated factor 1 [Dunckerocampus dactyliophorus]
MEDNEAAAANQTEKADKNSSENPSQEAGGACKASGNDEIRWSRLKLFDKVMQKSLEKFIDLASFNRFASMFHQLYKMNPRRVESIHKQFIEELRRAIKDDISTLIEEGRLEAKLNELDELESAAKNNPDPAWRPSGVPEQDFSSFVMPFYQKQKAYLRLELKKIQAENATLAQKVLAGRERIAQTENHISAAVADWKASVTEFESLASSLCPADVFDV